jgi:hypothetical protein
LKDSTSRTKQVFAIYSGLTVLVLCPAFVGAGHYLSAFEPVSITVIRHFSQAVAGFHRLVITVSQVFSIVQVWLTQWRVHVAQALLVNR